MPTDSPEPVNLPYRFVMTMFTPFVRWWGRLEVAGAEQMPTSGPTLIVGNHDSKWDPGVIGNAGRRRRQVRALAKSSLWKLKPMALLLDSMGHVPVNRGAGDSSALDDAVDRLYAGQCIGVFLEGTISRGKRLRARSGAGRLAQRVPEAYIVCVAIKGSTDIARFPKRPRIKVEFFAPAGGQPRPGEDPAELSARLLAEIRARAPISKAGRKP
jgi:1-acyl-sn-glycerol-3-phosphate acyltransferase